MNDLTFCMPVYNGSATIKMALTRIAQQGILEPHIIINLTWGFDGTLELLNALKRNHWFPDMRMDIFSVPRRDCKPHIHRVSHIALARQQLVVRVETPYLMFVDCDVLLWPDTVLTLLKEMEEDKTIGMLGVPYNGSEHVQMGATILRTEVAKVLNWNVDRGCDCQHITKQLRAKNHKVLHSTVERARHLTFDRIG